MLASIIRHVTEERGNGVVGDCPSQLQRADAVLVGAAGICASFTQHGDHLSMALGLEYGPPQWRVSVLVLGIDENTSLKQETDTGDRLSMRRAVQRSPTLVAWKYERGTPGQQHQHVLRLAAQRSVMERTPAELIDALEVGGEQRLEEGSRITTLRMSLCSSEESAKHDCPTSLALSRDRPLGGDRRLLCLVGPLSAGESIDVTMGSRACQAQWHCDDAIGPLARRLIVQEHVRLGQEPGEQRLDAQLARCLPRVLSATGTPAEEGHASLVELTNVLDDSNHGDALGASLPDERVIDVDVGNKVTWLHAGAGHREKRERVGPTSLALSRERRCGARRIQGLVGWCSSSAAPAGKQVRGNGRILRPGPHHCRSISRRTAQVHQASRITQTCRRREGCSTIWCLAWSATMQITQTPHPANAFHAQPWAARGVA